MNYSKKALLTVAALLALVVPVIAQAAEPASIAVVDVQLLLTDSKAGKNIQAQLEERKSKFLSQISQEEQKLREDEKTLSDQRASLSADDFAKKAKVFEEKLTDTRRQAQERKKALEDGANKALGKLHDEIFKVVQGISTAKGYTLVINRQNVVISSKEMDITQEALDKLNQDISQIPLEIKDK